MKPKLVFGFGAFSASTPLYKTLIKEIPKHVAKEPNILPAIISKNPDSISDKYKYCKKKNREGCEVFQCTSIDDYIQWLLRHHNNEYLGVSDATNTHIFFDVTDISTFAFKFKEAFQVKILIICRDPVKRLFSHLNSILNPGHSLDNLGQNERLELVIPYLDKPEPIQFPGQGWDYRQKAYEPYINKVKLNGHESVETRGTWELTKDFMAGPFINYIVRDSVNKRNLLLDGFVFSPSSLKREMIFELEAIFRSLKIYKR